MNQTEEIWPAQERYQSMHYMEQMPINDALKRLRAELGATMPDNPAIFGWSSFSQCDEDGIIDFIISRISENCAISNTCIEIGCSNGLENNTHQLLLDGYSGFWVDGDKVKIDFLKNQLGSLRFERLLIHEALIGLDNVTGLVESGVEFLGTKDLDFLSVDIDGNDLHIVQSALVHSSPKLLCVEYNAKFPPPRRLVMNYNYNHRWADNDYYGASLQSWVDMLVDYTLVCCNLSGVNAFFVRNNVAAHFTKYPIEDLYQPERFWLANGSFGHKNSLCWLKQSLINEHSAHTI